MECHLRLAYSVDPAEPLAEPEPTYNCEFINDRRRSVLTTSQALRPHGQSRVDDVLVLNDLQSADSPLI